MVILTNPGLGSTFLSFPVLGSVLGPGSGAGSWDRMRNPKSRSTSCLGLCCILLFLIVFLFFITNFISHMLGEDSIYAMNIVDRLNLIENGHLHTEICQNSSKMTVNTHENG